MRIDIHFRHMDRSETLERTAIEKVEHTADGFLHRHDAHIQVWLVSDLNRTTRGTGQFTCEIEVRYPRKRHFFIEKSSSDMYAAIQECCEKLQVLLDEAGKREIDLKHAPRVEPLI